ncbi:NADH:ubiquinone reductase (Na(+)-transporting) subunit C [Flavilitoribacter nigricans]|uniref:Na(+)-translocating NADH-quinone reductase subunit C n=1 Tax=Flavilitoribacter nigricans (strain ATCC 23147 / DSM 23189 / NBRC 102662 / NCIMB 1420 / SS-2) TaxID=1122177 RepID=A0A2D0NE08_FLAN2|nr:NADH:ubiquinone reductase (Na(+)-transporting) subunit C [Flavilitoribacter nigricans]PHN06638.1 NADH:ubiquinone reductase (Na(+)-transporting) subunit C [Flavilitoribacter nigricans DSM 23189 = NBRC 102662]
MSTRYVITFVTIMTAIVAVLLTGFRQATKAQAELNEDIFNKRAILSAVEDYLGEGVTVASLTDDAVMNIFQTQVEQVVVDASGQVVDGMMADDIDMAKEKKKPEPQRKFPLYIYSEGGSKYYILAVRGTGLWDAIWGNIALKSDLNTVVGATFDHAGETPGLGAEIKDNPAFPAQFKGKEIYTDNGRYVSITVRKGGARDPEHEVDAITGATVTSDGVSDMLYDGIKNYEPYFDKVKQSSQLITQ